MKISSGLLGLFILTNIVNEVVAKDSTFVAWKKIPETGRKGSKNNVKGNVNVSVDHAVMSEKLQETAKVNGVAKIAIDLALAGEGKKDNNAAAAAAAPSTGPVDCELRRYPVMAPELAAEYPNILAASGVCQDGSNVIFTIDKDTEGSFHGYIFRGSDGAHFVIDPDDDGNDNPSRFVFSRAKDRPVPKEASLWSDSILADSNGSDSSTGKERENNGRRKLEVSGSAIHTFRIAIMTSTAYSDYHINLAGAAADPEAVQRATVLSAVVTVMARVNGIFMRELATFFQLVPNNDGILCINDNTPVCTTNDMSAWPLMEDHFAANGITDADYDIGHIFVSSFGGVVGDIGNLCNDAQKHEGLTGLPDPIGYRFSVDFVAHELGHQLNGRHTFRDCANFGEAQANEPGSGTTIMGYPSLCGASFDVQGGVDPYFNSLTLDVMRTYVNSVSCGTTFDANVGGLISNFEPQTVTDTTCTVPKGNYVELTGSVTNANANQFVNGLFYSWDRIDTGPESYLDTNVPRFAPRIPTMTGSTRYLPNMYILSFDNVQTLEEIEPQASVPGPTVMDFRFMARTAYTDATLLNAYDIASAGFYGFTDLTVTYDDQIAPLSIENPPTVLSEGEMASIAWTGGVPDAPVEILMAFNTMRRIPSPDFDSDVEELQWVSVGEFTTSPAEFTVPSLLNEGDLPLNLMARSSASGGCTSTFYFDLKNNIMFLEEGETAAPSDFRPIPVTPPPQPVPTTNFELNILTDNFPFEITWNVVDECTGSTVLSGGPYALTGTEYIETGDLPPSSYMFNIFDSSNDGLCCQFGMGSFDVIYEGSVVGSGNEYGSSAAVRFGESTCPPTNFEVSIMTDFFPSETTWNVIDDCTNTIVASGGPYSMTQTQFIQRTDLPPSRYTFNIFDSASDGLGGFNATYEGEVVASGAIFFTSMLSFPFGGNFTCPENNFELSIVTDNFPSETTWELYNECTNELVLSGGPYAQAATEFTQSATLPPSGYSFFLFDSAGDGICCGFGEGSYSVTYDGVQVASGGEFGSSTTVTFGEGTNCTVPTPAPSFSNSTLTPTPTPVNSQSPVARRYRFPDRKSPTKSPSSDAMATCVEQDQYACGFVGVNRDGNPTPGYYSVCLKNSRGSSRTQCLHKSQLESIRPGDRILGGRYEIEKCGCCVDDEENRFPDFCDYNPLPCPIEEYTCGLHKSRTYNVEPIRKVEYCYLDKWDGELKTECGNPFKNVNGRESFRGCGERCVNSRGVPQLKASKKSKRSKKDSKKGKKDSKRTKRTKRRKRGPR